jgi:hypothetical protein
MRTFDLSDNVTDDAYFTLEVSVSYPGKTGQVTCSTRADDDEAKPKILADKDVVAYDIGYLEENEQTIYLDDPAQAEINFIGDATFEHYAPQTEYTYPTPPPPFPHPEEDPEGLWIRYFPGYTDVTGFRDHAHTGYVDDISLLMCAHTSLTDDVRETHGTKGGDGFKAKYFGLKRGAYFYVSYGGKEHNVLEPNEVAMDFMKNTGTTVWELFPGGEVKVENVASMSQGYDIDTVEMAGTVFGITAAIITALQPETAWIGAFWIAGESVKYITSLERKDGAFDGGAQGVAYCVCKEDEPDGGQRVVYSGGPGLFSQSGVCTEEPPTNPPAPACSRWLNLPHTGEVHCSAGNQYCIFVELASECSATSVEWTQSKYVSANVKYRELTSGEWNTLDLEILE